jgi:hypothetical protein
MLWKPIWSKKYDIARTFILGMAFQLAVLESGLFSFATIAAVISPSYFLGIYAGSYVYCAVHKK